jgi:hypothetical protein
VALQSAVPTELDARARKAWAAKEYAAQVKARQDEIRPRLRPGAELGATLKDGELAFLVDGAPVVDRVFVSKAEELFFLAQWNLLASTLTFSESASAKAFCNALRTLVPPTNLALADQVISLTTTLQDCEQSIAAAEESLNTLLFDLYGLSDAEREMVRQDRGEAQRRSGNQGGVAPSPIARLPKLYHNAGKRDSSN